MRGAGRGDGPGAAHGRSRASRDPARRRRREAKSLRGDDAAVSDVVGTILMVGITVTMMVGLTILVLGASGPTDRVNMDAQLGVRPGSDGQWGTGDETVRLQNVGGESLATKNTVIRITINGTATDYSGSGLDQDFADGSFVFGDIWEATLTIPKDSRVQIFVIDLVSNSIVTSGALGAVAAAETGGAPSTTYVSANSMVTGTIASFDAAKSGDDSGAEAVLTEELASGSATQTLDANGVNNGQTHADWTNPANAVGQDDTDATATSNQQRPLQLTIENGATEGSVTKVVLKARVAITGYANDNFRLSACFDATCGTASGDLEGSSGYTTIEYDATGAKPGGGAWSWADIPAMEVRVENTRDGGPDGTWRVDHVWAELTHTTAAAYTMDGRFHWSGVPSGDQQLQLRYRVANDTFDFEVWNGVTWAGTHGPLDSTTGDIFVYDLQASEYNGGSPRIRFVDRGTGSDPGQIFIDYARVVTTP